MNESAYNELPAYLKGWEVCLLPFAMNESTKFISPTKVLEYMAVDKAIVSTPITDVMKPYGDFVRIGDTPAEFIRQCDEALSASQEDREFRIAAGRAVLAQTSWDRTADAMDALIDRGRSQKGASLGMEAEEPIVVAGAGPTGLSAAYHLGPPGGEEWPGWGCWTRADTRGNPARAYAPDPPDTGLASRTLAAG